MAAILHRAGCELRTGADGEEALVPRLEPQKAISRKTIMRMPIAKRSSLPAERLDGARSFAIQI
jgi:hypothetical protein